MNNIEGIQEYAHKLLHEIQFWQINLKLMEIAVEREEKNILLLQKKVIDEIDRIQTKKEKKENGS